MADKGNIIEVILKFLIDKSSQLQGRAAIEDLNKAAAAPGAQGGMFAGWQTAAKTVIDMSKAMSLSIEETAARLSTGFETSGQSFNQTKEQLVAAVGAYNQMTTAAEQAAKAVRMQSNVMDRLNTPFGRNMLLGITGFTMSMTGAKLAQHSQALTKPVQDYIKYVGLAEQSSRSWLGTTDKITQANLRIGRALADSTLPIQKTLVDLAERYASALENSKFLAGVIGTASAVGQVVGGGIQATGQVISAVASFRTLQILMNASAAGQTAIAAAAATTATAATSSAVAASASAEAAVASAATATTAGATVGAETAAGAGLAAGGAAVGVSGAAVGGGILATMGTALMSVATLLLPLIAAIAVVTTAIIVLNKFFESEAGKGVSNTAKQTGALIAGAITGILKGREAGNEEFLRVSRESGLIGGGAAKPITSINGVDITQEMIDSFVKYQQANLEATQQTEEQRSQILEDAGKKRAELERTYEEQRTEIMTDLAKSQAREIEDLQRTRAKGSSTNQRNERQEELDYYRARLKVINANNKEALRAEEDHQDKISEMRQEHELTAQEALDQLDAYALLKENRRYELSRQQEESNYGKEVRRRDEDLADRLAEMESDFANAREKREQERILKQQEDDADLAFRQARDTQDAQARIDKLAKDHDLEMKQLDDQTKEKISEIETNAEKEAVKRTNAFNDQMRELDAHLLDEYNIKNDWYAAESLLLDAYLQAAKNKGVGTNLPGYPTGQVQGNRAAGGPVWEGLWQLHDNERVLNQQENVLWQNIMSGKSVSKGSGGITVQQNFTFKGTFTEGDKRWFRETAREQAYAAVEDVVNAV